jgi:hypothetical protein
MENDQLSSADTEEDDERWDMIMRHDLAMSEREDAIMEILEVYD